MRVDEIWQSRNVTEDISSSRLTSFNQCSNYVLTLKTASQDRVTANSHAILSSFDLDIKLVYKYRRTYSSSKRPTCRYQPCSERVHSYPIDGISREAKEFIAILLSASAVKRNSL